MIGKGGVFEVSSHLLCSELELNPNILPMLGLSGKDPMISWRIFLETMSLLLLQKDVLDLRF